MEGELQPRGAAPVPSMRKNIVSEQQKSAVHALRQKRGLTSASQKQRQRRANDRNSSAESFLQRAARIAAQHCSFSAADNALPERVVLELDVDAQLNPIDGQPVQQLYVAVQTQSSTRVHRVGAVHVRFDSRGLCDIPLLGVCTRVCPNGQNDCAATVRFEVDGLREHTLQVMQQQSSQ